MKYIFKNLKWLMFFGILFGGIIYANTNNIWINPEVLMVNKGDVLSSKSWNNILSNIDYLKEENHFLEEELFLLKENISLLNEAPKNAIMAFNQAICPLGWIPADGTAGTPDLRGVFIRGANSFDNGLTSNVRDKDREIIQAGLGTEQIDAIIEIEGGIATGHSLGLFAPVQYGALKLGYGGAGGSVAGKSGSYSKGFEIKASRSIGEEHIGSDIRPKNVALIYCVKQ